MLKPSEHGVGVFATHDILAGTYLRLFGDDNPIRRLPKSAVPEPLRGFCVDRGDALVCPPDFGYMPVGWYLNHSQTPNTVLKDKFGQYGKWFAVRDIQSGEEIMIDYNFLEEPEATKADYYTN